MRPPRPVCSNPDLTESGQALIEYGGVLVIVALIVATVFWAGIAGLVEGGVSRSVDSVFGASAAHGATDKNTTGNSSNGGNSNGNNSYGRRPPGRARPYYDGHRVDNPRVKPGTGRPQPGDGSGGTGPGEGGSGPGEGGSGSGEGGSGAGGPGGEAPPAPEPPPAEEPIPEAGFPEVPIIPLGMHDF